MPKNISSLTQINIMSSKVCGLSIYKTLLVLRYDYCQQCCVILLFYTLCNSMRKFLNLINLKKNREKTLVYQTKGCVYFDVSTFTHKTMPTDVCKRKKAIFVSISASVDFLSIACVQNFTSYLFQEWILKDC